MTNLLNKNLSSHLKVEYVDLMKDPIYSPYFLS